MILTYPEDYEGCRWFKSDEIKETNRMHDYIRELHYIVAIANVPSIVKNGILCYEKASKVAHISVASREVQERRKKKKIPNGLPLHEYVNLYLNARNPMLYYLMENASRISVYYG